MTPLALSKESIQPRIDGIQKNIATLQKFGELSAEEFSRPETYERAAYNLRLALEGVFNITAHILSRFPGSRETEYKRMARQLGELGVVSKEFASTTLTNMAGYRNRLTHFYAEVKTDELHTICREHLSDIEQFLKYVKELMRQPDKFNLAVE